MHYLPQCTATSRGRDRFRWCRVLASLDNHGLGELGRIDVPLFGLGELGRMLVPLFGLGELGRMLVPLLWAEIASAAYEIARLVNTAKSMVMRIARIRLRFVVDLIASSTTWNYVLT
jgi:hypothetical protein